MSVTTVVTRESFDATVKQALSEFLSTYFDGATHTIGGKDVAFPKAEAWFFPHALPRPLSSPLIVAAQMPSRDQRFFMRGTQRELVWRFTSYDADRSGRTRDRMSTLLQLIFTDCRVDLAPSGLKVAKVGIPAVIDDPAFEYFTTQRLITFKILV